MVKPYAAYEAHQAPPRPEVFVPETPNWVEGRNEVATLIAGGFL